MKTQDQNQPFRTMDYRGKVALVHKKSIITTGNDPEAMRRLVENLNKRYAKPQPKPKP